MKAKTREAWQTTIGIALVLLVGTVGTVLAGSGDRGELPSAHTPPELTKRPEPVEDVSRDWKGIGPEGGRIEALVQCPSNPQRMYALPYRLGLFRSDDRGESWSRVASDLPLDTHYQALAASPADADVVLLAEQVGSEVLRSTDGGRTWRPHNVGVGWVGVKVALHFDPHDPDHVLLVAGGEESDECGFVYDSGPGGLYRSTDGGRSWDAVSQFSSPTGIAFDPGTPGTILVGSEEGISRSIDNGVTWSQTNRRFIRSVSLSFCRDVPSRVWAVGVDAPGYARLLRSDDGGVTFWDVDVPEECPSCPFATIAAHPVDPDQALVGREYPQVAGTTVFRSTDGGWSWPQVYDSSLEGGAQSISALAFDLQMPDRIYLAITNLSYQRWNPPRMASHGLVRSDDGGTSWAPGMRGIQGFRIAGLGDDAAGSIWVRAGTDRGLYRTESPDDAWTTIEASRSGRWVAPSLFHVDERTSGVLHEITGYFPSCQHGDGGNGHFLSTNGGIWWSSSSWSRPWPWSGYEVIVADLLVTGGGPDFYVWIHDGWNRGVVHLRIGGGSESFVTEFLAAGAAMDPADPLRMFAVDSESPGNVFLTTDGGATWAPSPGRANGLILPTDRGIGLFMDPADSDRLVVVYETSGVWETTDAGNSWRQIPTGTGLLAVVAADWDPSTNRVFLATREDGVWVSGLGWTGDRLPTRDLTDIDFVRKENVVLLGTDHAGAFALRLPSASPDGGVASLVAAESQSASLKLGVETGELRLSGIAPNPFVHSTTIGYELPRASQARVTIHDVTGRLVLTLRETPSTVGSHSLIWDGRDGSGASVAAGTYFVRLDSGHQARTKKVLYLGRNSP